MQDDRSDRLADEFLDRRLRGDTKDVVAFLAEHPELTAAERERVTHLARALCDGDAAGALAAEPVEAPPHERIGDFRLLRKLGEGGMGVVWLAEQESLRRTVALKLLRPESLASRRAAERFEREARTVAQLHHPGIVPVLAAGAEAGVRFLAMEYVEGRGLDELIADAVARGQMLSVVDAVRCCRDVARALASAHAAGVIHRDVKPSNVRVTAEGRALLLDFGLARAEGDPKLSQTGHFLGSPGYAAPEQIEARGEVDARSDVYSLGVVLYECVVGRVPFDGTTTQQLFHQILHREPPAPRARNAAVSRELEAVVLCALEKDPARRYPSAAAFADELDALLEMRPVRARPSGAFRRAGKWARRNPAAALATALGALVVLGTPVGYAWFEHDARERIAQEHTGTVREHTEVLRLADAITLKRLENEGRELWPERAERATAMEQWLAATADLLRNEAGHRETLARWEAQATAPGAATDDTLRWRIETSRDLLSAMARLHEQVKDVTQRLAVARSIRADTVDQHAEEWDEAINAVATHPDFNGLEIEPQIGLVPLGPDPRSGLQEFWAPESGERPVRDPSSGRYQIGETTGLVLVLLPGAKLKVGDLEAVSGGVTKDSAARHTMMDDLPVNEVTLAPFFLSKYEMTQSQWVRIGGVNASFYRPSTIYQREGSGLHGPVDSVPHSVAIEVLHHIGLRLPSEAQWEYAARAGTTTPWWTGSALNSVADAGNLFDQALALVVESTANSGAESWNDGFRGPAPVGSFRPNPFGLHDTIGNVAEWCLDYATTYTQPTHGPDALRVRLSDGGDPEYIVRGGAFNMRAYASTSYRRSYSVEAGFRNIGVRPARMIEAR